MQVKTRFGSWEHQPYEEWEHPEIKNLKQLIAAYEVARPAAGFHSPICDVLDFLKSQPDDGSKEAVRTACSKMFLDPKLGPEVNMLAIVYPDIGHDPATAAKIQYYGAYYMTQLEWSPEVRAQTEHAFANTKKFYSKEALLMLVDMMAEHHPCPGPWMAQQYVHRHIPKALTGDVVTGSAEGWPEFSEADSAKKLQS